MKIAMFTLFKLINTNTHNDIKENQDTFVTLFADNALV